MLKLQHFQRIMDADFKKKHSHAGLSRKAGVKVLQ